MKTKKEMAQHFLQLCAKGHSREAFGLYAGESFRHHNAYFKGDADTLMLAMEESAKSNPNTVLNIQRALEDNDIVAIHSHIKHKPGDLGIAVIHIFRFDGDKIAEFWDFGQPVPANRVNENGMF